MLIVLFNIISTVLGVVIGSFLNVCIFRIPLGKSVVYPSSYCPNCGKKLGILELVPIVSFFIQRGRCKGCKKPICWRYPLIELITGILFLLVFLRYGITIETVKFWVFISLVIPIAFIDLEKQIIPNLISIPGIVLGLVLSYNMLLNSFLGIAIGFGIIALVIILSRGGMGWGDAKLLAMIGAFWGWRVVLYSLVLGSLFGSIVGVVLLFTHRIERKTPIAFGPYLCLGAVLIIFLNNMFPLWQTIFP